MILDNGAYEGVPIRAAQLSAIVNALRPSVVVLPDEPNDFVKTFRKSFNYLEEHPLPHGVEGMFVLHAEAGKLEHFELAYELAPTKWIGFSRLTKSYSGKFFNDTRAQMLMHLKQRGLYRDDRVHHALGMKDGSLVELQDCKRAGFHSCDSSSPIWRGLNGYLLGDRTNWPNYEMDPEAPFNGVEPHQARENLKAVLEVCNG